MKRKSRCDPGIPRCAPCERSNAKCVYYDSARQTTIPRTYIVSLRAKAHALANEIEAAEKDIRHVADAIAPEMQTTPLNEAMMRLFLERGDSAAGVVNALPTDSGYGSLDRYKIDLSWPGDRIQDFQDEFSDTTSVYSDTSDASDFREKGYIHEFADFLFKKVSNIQLAGDTLEHVTENLPAILKAFALRVGLNAPTQMHRDIMFFVHKYRK
jgi:hypothetical protein